MQKDWEKRWSEGGLSQLGEMGAEDLCSLPYLPVPPVLPVSSPGHDAPELWCLCLGAGSPSPCSSLLSQPAATRSLPCQACRAGSLWEGGGLCPASTGRSATASHGDSAASIQGQGGTGTAHTATPNSSARLSTAQSSTVECQLGTAVPAQAVAML